MPVIGTPLASGTQIDFRVTPPVTRVEGVPNPAKLRSAKVSQGQPATINWGMRDSTGNPVDLTRYGFENGAVSSSSSSSSSLSTAGVEGTETYYLQARIREHLSFTPNKTSTLIDATVEDAATGLVSVKLTRAVVALPGIFVVEIGLINAAQDLVFSDTFFLIVDPGQFGLTTVQGPLTVAEVRLHLRDSGPEDNYLLDEVEYDLAELAACISRPVLYWNEAQPPIYTNMTTQNFPFRFHWLEGTVAGLYEMAAHHYRRNRLTYSAAGTALDDKNKAQEYEQKAQQKWQEYKLWVQTKKAQLNAQRAFGTVGLHRGGRW